MNKSIDQYLDDYLEKCADEHKGYTFDALTNEEYQALLKFTEYILEQEKVQA